MKKRISLVLLVLLLISFAFEYNLSAYLTKTQAPDFRLYNLKGKIDKLSNYKGKIVVLNFFATWCPPCKMEIPGFVKFYKNYKKEGVVILGICLDANDKSKVKSFIKQYQINYPVLIGTRDVVMDYGGIHVIPTTFIINGEGYIVDRIIGYLNDEDLKSKINKLIENKKVGINYGDKK